MSTPTLDGPALAQALGLITPGPHDLITDGDDAISTNASVLASLLFWRGYRPLTGNEDLDTLPTAGYTVWNGAVATALDLPEISQGTLLVFRWGKNGGNMLWLTRSLTPTIWITSKLSGGWVPWTEVGATSAGVAGGTGATSASPSGYKTVPLAVTLGNGGASRAAAEGTVRIPLHFAAPITRWRLHISDGNPRFSLTKPTTFRVRNVRVGDRDGLAITNPVNVAGVDALAGSDGWVSPWITTSITGPKYLQIAYDQASADPIGLVGGCYINPDPRKGWTDAADGFTPSQTCPFDIWIEAETRAGTPVVAVVGDSNGAGVGTTMPVHDSWLSQWARAHDALPVHYAHSGDSLANQGDATARKWTRWAHLARPDMAIIATGSNDLAGTVTLEEMQKRFADVAAVAAELLSPIIHAVTIKPRNGEPAGSLYDAGRKAYNQWLNTVPDPARAVHDFVTPVSSTDQVMDEGMHAADGTHMTTAGHAALAAALPASITPGPLLYTR